APDVTRHTLNLSGDLEEAARRGQITASCVWNSPDDVTRGVSVDHVSCDATDLPLNFLEPVVRRGMFAPHREPLDVVRDANAGHARVQPAASIGGGNGTSTTADGESGSDDESARVI